MPYGGAASRPRHPLGTHITKIFRKNRGFAVRLLLRKNFIRSWGYRAARYYDQNHSNRRVY